MKTGYLSGFISLLVFALLLCGCTGSETNTTTTSAITTITTTTLFAQVTTTVPVSQSIYNVSFLRRLPSSAASGSVFDVEIIVSFNDSKKPALIGLIENYPSGWAASNVSNGGILRDKQARIEWLFWAMGSPVQNTTLRYQLTAPVGTEGTYFFDGNATIGRNQWIETTGDNNVTMTTK